MKSSPSIFSPLELEKAKKELLFERLHLLPVTVREDGYYYDFKEFDEALRNAKVVEKKN